MEIKTTTPQRILAGDIGGTRTRLGLFRLTQKTLRFIREQKYSSKNYKGLEKILKDFLSGEEKIASACFGVAGPVTSRIIRTTNLPWRIHLDGLQKVLSTKKVEVINDLVANAYGIFMLEKKDFQTLNTGQKRKGNAGILSAGTGLGEAILFWDGKQHIPSPSEGGHVEFGPRNDLEMELLQSLSGHFLHVSYERILSGAGLLQIYQFLRDSKRFRREPEWLSGEMKEKDPAAIISEMARLKRSRLCGKALDLFVSIYGAAAGNLALQVMALEGIYLGGGIAPKILWKLKDGSFMKAFKDKGRFSKLMVTIPVKVVMNDKTALLGAAWHAMELLDER